MFRDMLQGSSKDNTSGGKVKWGKQGCRQPQRLFLSYSYAILEKLHELNLLGVSFDNGFLLDIRL